MATHFVNFVENSQTYANAVRVFGKPAFFHRLWDDRAKYGGEFDPATDVYIFAKGTVDDTPTHWSYNDSEQV